MKKITRKSEVTEALAPCLEAFRQKGLEACVQELDHRLLQNKVKFPLLEYIGHTLFEEIPEEQQVELADRIAALQTEGGNVLLGILLQNRLPNHFDQSIQKAVEYIDQGGIWYVCDIIGERVFGVSLLNDPEKTLPEIKKLSRYPSNWVVRSLGAGSHYAIKKGLGKKYVKKVFQLLLTMADTKDKEVRQGIGWAAKTTAKFHPDLIEEFQPEIQDTEKVAEWFRTKVNIGLERNRHEGN